MFPPKSFASEMLHFSVVNLSKQQNLAENLETRFYIVDYPWISMDYPQYIDCPVMEDAHTQNL